MRKSLCVFLFLVLSGCTSIPVSTMGKMSRFDEADFVGIAPDVVRLIVRIPAGFSLNVSETALNIDLVSANGRFSGRYTVREISHKNVVSPGGLFSSAQQKVEYLLMLDEASLEKFLDVKAFVRSNTPISDLSLNVKVKLGERPVGAKSISFDVDLLLNEKDGFFALVDGASVDLVDNG